VLLVRLDGIGDALVCAPLVAALKSAGHELGAVLSTRNREAFAAGTFAHVHVLERIPWPKHGSTPESHEAALAQARAVGYDTALVVSEELEAYEFARAAGARRRIGFVNGWEKPLKTLRLRALLDEAVVRPASAARSDEHEVETVFRLGRELHDEALPTRDPARLAPLVLDAPAAPHGRVAVQLSQKLARFGLDVRTWILILRALAARTGPVLALADDAELAGAVRAAGIDVTLPDASGWKAAIAGARALVAPDSGSVHVAGLTGVPSLALFAPGRTVMRDIARWSPWAAPGSARLVAPRGGDFLARDVSADVERLLVEPSTQ
jgi:ADP-heptose:LPS heptosyltransferase